MVLTYNMVLSRLDTLNQREQEVRKFYKPMPKVDQDPTKPYPHRHRFADVLEPGDVVRTIDKSGEDGGGGDENIEEGQSPRGEQVGRLPTSIAAQQLNDLRQNRPLGPGRESQRHVTQTAKKERQLRKSIDGELRKRAESLKSRLYSEAGITEDGEKGPKDDVIDIIDPLFKQVGKATMTYPKPLVQKTGSATSMEIKISEPIPRFAGGPGPYRHASEQGAILAPAEQEQAQAEGEMPEEGESLSRLQSADSQRSDTSGRPLRPASRAGKSVGLAMPEDANQSATNDEAEMAHLFQGPVSTWTYRKSVYSEHDDPDRREFYFTQLTLPPSELELDPAENAYIVHIQGISLRDRPVHVCKAAGVNDQGKLMFLRGAETDAAMASSVLSTADELPWVTDPTQLKGQQLKISIYRRKTTSTTTATSSSSSSSQTQDGDTFVSERLVTFRASQLEGGAAIPSYPHPPTSAPQGARDYGRTAGIAAAAPHRPDTAPAISPSKSWSDSKLGSMRSPDTSFSASGGVGRGVGLGGGGSPKNPQNLHLDATPAARWNAWAESGDTLGTLGAHAPANPAVRELSQDNRSFEESPAAKKKKELARMRQQMRASLQQTQSQVLASMGAPPAAIHSQPAAAAVHAAKSAARAASPAGVLLHLSDNNGARAEGDARDARAPPMTVMSKAKLSADVSSPAKGRR